MTTDTVTYLILGFPPRRIRLELPANTPGRFIAANAPKRAFAYLRSDEGNATTHYIDAPRAIERVRQDALIALISDIIADNRTVTNADKLDDTDVKLGAELYRQELKRRLPVTTAAMGL